MAFAWLLRVVPVLLRHDGAVARHRREDVLDQRRRSQHDLAVTGRRRVWSRLPPTTDTPSQADAVRPTNRRVVAGSFRRRREKTTSTTAAAAAAARPR